MTGVVQVRRPKAICFDILGTASKSGFLERILFPFLKSNLESYLTKHWDEQEFKHLFKRIQQSSVEINKTETLTPVVLGQNTAQGKSSLIAFLNFCTENGIQSPPVTQLRFKVWFEGYQNSKLLTPIYSDVPASMRRWFAEGIKFYVFSNTWVEAQKALLRNTTHGDLTNLIAGHYDNDFGPLTDTESWRRFCAQVHQKPEDLLFLTKSVHEGHAAKDAGIQVVLVLTHRHNVKAVGHEDRQRFPYVRTLNDLQWLEGSMMPGPASEAAATSASTSATSIPASQAPLQLQPASNVTAITRQHSSPVVVPGSSLPGASATSAAQTSALASQASASRQASRSHSSSRKPS